MITIENTMEKNVDGKRTLYIIKIDGEVISKFWHDRDYGLSACLESASNSVSNITHSSKEG